MNDRRGKIARNVAWGVQSRAYLCVLICFVRWFARGMVRRHGVVAMRSEYSVVCAY